MRTYHIASDRTTVFHEIPAQGILLLSVRRDEFDSWHTEQAKKAGSEVQLSTSVVDILESEGRLQGVVTDKGAKSLPAEEGQAEGFDAGHFETTEDRQALSHGHRCNQPRATLTR
jgi:flavin-dependent dehydrogenase